MKNQIKAWILILGSAARNMVMVIAILPWVANTGRRNYSSAEFAFINDYARKIMMAKDADMPMKRRWRRS